MDREKVNELHFELNNLDYLDKQSVYQKVFSLGNLASDDMNEKLVLISLVALVTQKMREKDPLTNPLKLLMQITGQIKDNSFFYQFLESLSIIVEDFMYGCKKFDPCGLKSSQEIINRIKEILSTWLPF